MADKQRPGQFQFGEDGKVMVIGTELTEGPEAWEKVEQLNLIDWDKDNAKLEAWTKNEDGDDAVNDAVSKGGEAIERLSSALHI